jgi:adenosylcobinamide-GDP ribazoletransferase
MIAEWRLFLLALRYFTRIPVPGDVLLGAAPFNSAARYLPLVGIVVGIGAGGMYWLAAQLWPTSLAVILALLAAVLITGGLHEQGLAETCALIGGSLPRERTLDRQDAHRGGFGALGMLFVLLTKYNALMGLSAANLSFVVPADLRLGLIMLAGHAASRALVVSVIASPPRAATGIREAAGRISGGELAFALICGFAPSILLGTPALIGLAAAIVVRMLMVAGARRLLLDRPGDFLGATQQLTELAF